MVELADGGQIEIRVSRVRRALNMLFYGISIRSNLIITSG